MAETFIHESAYIDEGAEVGAGSRIWHFCHVMPGAKIGSDCVLGQNVFVGVDVIVGNRVKIQNNVSLYTGVIVEDDVFLGPSMVFTNVINPRSAVERKSEFKATIVRRGASIGANATLICGIELGAYAFVGAGAVITRDVKPYAVMAGVPAKQIGWMCQCGEKLAFDGGSTTCPACGKRYKRKDGRIELIGESYD
jgi:UDP-2-acetamido-3-amino-2,3-dideoxy-glucuronate N-acetyltransferase